MQVSYSEMMKIHGSSYSSKANHSPAPEHQLVRGLPLVRGRSSPKVSVYSVKRKANLEAIIPHSSSIKHQALSLAQLVSCSADIQSLSDTPSLARRKDFHTCFSTIYDGFKGVLGFGMVPDCKYPRGEIFTSKKHEHCTNTSIVLPIVKKHDIPL